MMTQEEIDQAFEEEVKPEFDRIYSESGSTMSKGVFFMMDDSEEIASFRQSWLRITLGIQEAGLIAPELVEGMVIREEAS